MSFNEKFQAGEAYGDGQKTSDIALADPAQIAADLLRDYVGLRSQVSLPEITDLIKSLIEKGKPLDDKKG